MEISTYVKPTLPYQVNIDYSIIVKRHNETYDAGVIRCVGVQWKETKCVELSWKYQVSPIVKNTNHFLIV